MSKIKLVVFLTLMSIVLVYNFNVNAEDTIGELAKDYFEDLYSKDNVEVEVCVYGEGELEEPFVIFVSTTHQMVYAYYYGWYEWFGEEKFYLYGRGATIDLPGDYSAVLGVELAIYEKLAGVSYYNLIENYFKNENGELSCPGTIEHVRYSKDMIIFGEVKNNFRYVFLDPYNKTYIHSSYEILGMEISHVDSTGSYSSESTLGAHTVYIEDPTVIRQIINMQQKVCYTNTYECKKSMREYAELKHELVTYCKHQMKYGNYNSSSIATCFNYSDIIREMEGRVYEVAECKLSPRLLKWIKNIMKWIKYILPSIAIILGIIDYIKSIVSDKEDEIKKAQGRFIKRLISIALLFLIPFVIEFVLDTFKFSQVSPFCDLLNNN